ncbi:aminodeoxychorismate/anthranilate synthase component II [Taibaiella lutea]|uniref:Aminodeoxychorismate/anthranilate synthase component II n=1 Tax=Taibaiella lutea TaxID=2608001 RepID=A0A5M6CGA6_9BACT|nr:aminodeoxychorismate/anthranilate synthase component II [Taibaiella lutea]KAA5533470.1 aminodeoxychorismate/anthranilate synthase component II [Taibaiella lutea]
MWALIDNYDSFTHILHHYLLQLQTDVVVFRNDAITLQELIKLNPERIIISPGPQTPKEAGITNEVIRHFVTRIPILGICLGHQALGEYFGAELALASKPVHGNTSSIIHNGEGLFKEIPASFNAMRYHSLILKHWEVTSVIPLAFTPENELMAFRHEVYPATGIQFHPESILTEYGMQLLRNWDESFK